MEIIASAPGKLFLLGEYAVTTGAPAVICATQRRLECRIIGVPGDTRITIRRQTGESYLCPTDVSIADQIPQPFRFAAVAALVGSHAAGLRNLNIQIIPGETLDQGTPKVGLGGSAAVTAAVLAGLAVLPGAETIRDPRHRARLGVQAHRLAQGGGSGADVAAATLGGLVWIGGLGDGDPAETAAQAARSDLPKLSVERLQLPTGLGLRALATGRPARSGPRAAHFQRAIRGNGPLGAAGAAGLMAWSDAMRDATEDFRTACHNDDPDTALRAMRAGGLLFGRLPSLSGIPVWSPELRRLQAGCAGEKQLSIKPSGAGGGDCAIALIRAPEGPFWQKNPDIGSFGSVELTTTGAGATAQQENQS